MSTNSAAAMTLEQFEKLSPKDLEDPQTKSKIASVLKTYNELAGKARAAMEEAQRAVHSEARILVAAKIALKEYTKLKGLNALPASAAFDHLEQLIGT